MANTSRTHHINPELEDALMTAAESGESARVKGKKAHLVRIDSSNIWETYDPNALIHVIDESANDPYSVSPAELEDLLADIRAARDQDSVDRSA